MISISEKNHNLKTKEEINILKCFQKGKYDQILNILKKIESENEYFFKIGALFGLGQIREVEQLLNESQLFINTESDLSNILLNYYKAKVLFCKNLKLEGYKLCNELILNIKQNHARDEESEKIGFMTLNQLKVSIYRLIGENKLFVGKNSNGLNYLLKSQKIFNKEEPSIERDSGLSYQIGRAYYFSDDLVNAKKYLLNSLELRLKLENSQNIALSLNMLGAVEEKKNNLTEALAYFKKAYEYILENSKNLLIISMIESNIGLALIKLGNLIEARIILSKALEHYNLLKKDQYDNTMLQTEIQKNLLILEKAIENNNEMYNKGKVLLSSYENLTNNPREIERLKQINTIIQILEKNLFGVYQKDLPSLISLSKATISRRIHVLTLNKVIDVKLEGKKKILILNPLNESRLS